MKHGAVEAVAYDRDNRNVLSVGTLQNDRQRRSTRRRPAIKLKASFPNADEKLWPGEFVNVTACWSRRGSNAVVVPNTAIQRGPKGHFVWALTDKNTAVPKPVETGPSIGDITIVDVAASMTATASSPAANTSCATNAPVSITDKPQPADDSES